MSVEEVVRSREWQDEEKNFTPKESFRILSHAFRGKCPGKKKLKKRMKKYHEDLKTKHGGAFDVLLLAVEKIKETQARLKTPHFVPSGHVESGQASDPRSGFATVVKEIPGSSTPMLGSKKVEHLLGIINKPESGSMGSPPAKKPN